MRAVYAALACALFLACGSSSSSDASGDDAGPPPPPHGDDASTPPGDDGGATDSGVDAGPVVVPYACPASSPEVVFVSEVAPPATLTPWQHFDASVTFANCGSETWSPKSSTPVRLGPSTPHDSRTWTRSRLELPADVPPGNAVTIAIHVHAPPLTGSHPYAYELVREGVAWLGHASPMHMIDVEAAMLPPISICPSASTDPSGRADATAQLQACIDATPSGGTLALPAGIYRVSGVLSITKPMTLGTAGVTGPSCLDYASAPCAVFRADVSTVPSASSTRGFLRLGTLGVATSNVTLDHVVVDGNRAELLAGTAASSCAAGQNGDGINVGSNCASCALKGFVSARAVCGSGFEHDGDGLVVDDSDFVGNGDHGTQNMWSDGLTIHKSDASHVTGTRFVDNSDVGFISGGGVDAVYTGNTAQQLVQSSFAAMMLDNFDNAALGDFTGATVDGNTVYCAPATACHFGIELGPHPWYASPNIKGASVTNNSVVGAYIEINAQGAGTASAPVVISGNTLGATPASAAFQCGNVNGLSPLNVSAESVVDLKGGTATGSISVPCP